MQIVPMKTIWSVNIFWENKKNMIQNAATEILACKVLQKLASKLSLFGSLF